MQAPERGRAGQGYGYAPTVYPPAVARRNPSTSSGTMARRRPAPMAALPDCTWKSNPTGFANFGSVSSKLPANVALSALPVLTGPPIVRLVLTVTFMSAVASNHTPAVFGKRSEEHTSELQSQSNLVCRL